MGVIVVRGAGETAEVLALRRHGGAFAGCWNIVTGMIEANETAIDAAYRELAEETRLVPRGLYTTECVDLFYDPIADGIQIVPLFAALVAAHAEPVLDASHDAAEWLAIPAAAERFTFATHRRIVAELPRTLLAGEIASWRRMR